MNYNNGLGPAHGARLGMSFRAVWDEYLAADKLPSIILMDGLERQDFLRKVARTYQAACDAERLVLVTKETA